MRFVLFFEFFIMHKVYMNLSIRVKKFIEYSPKPLFSEKKYQKPVFKSGFFKTNCGFSGISYNRFMKRFVMGDIHGAHKAFEQCLERSGFNTETDQLITLGDITDCWPEVHLCIQSLLKIPNRVCLMGNHDQWALQWMYNGWKGNVWVSQGGRATMQSFGNDPDKVPASNYNFLRNCKYIWVEKNCLFVHAGINLKKNLYDQNSETCLWDRKMVFDCYKQICRFSGTRFGDWDKIYVGHTPTQNFGTSGPLQMGNLILMDTGAGHGETLSMMDIDSGQVFQSDRTQDLYPDWTPRD